MTINDLVSKITDPYERKARLYPALLALLPLLAMISLLYATTATALSGVVGLAVSCGALYLMTNICRELGKRMEERLFRDWGAKPTTQLLRHRDKTIEAPTKQRYHSFLSARIGQAFPDHAAETTNPEEADGIYQSGVRWLLNNTRPDATKRFGLLFDENVAYGFRRNALGVRPLGLLISVFCLLWTLSKAGVLFGSSGKALDLAAIPRLPDAASASLVVSGIMFLSWTLFFTKKSVRTAAFTYAEMLLRACDELEAT